MGQTVPIELSPMQLKVDAVKRTQRAAGKPVRVVILKPRQVFTSVGVATEIYKDVAFLPGQHAMAFADSDKTVRNLWSYYEQLQRQYIPFEGIKQLKPLKPRFGDEVRWDRDSWVQTATAKTATSGKSYSIRHLQLDEYAYYGDSAALMTNVLNSVPDDVFTSIYVLSTANGLGGPFYELCQRAMDPARRGEWIFLFFAWFEHPEYTRPLSADGFDARRFQDSLDKQELHLMERDGVSLPQLNWRRWAVMNKCEGSIDRFNQEYPSSPELAFLTSGRPVYDSRALSMMPIVREPMIGGLQEVDIGTRRLVQFIPRDNGELRVWKRPQEGRAYVLGVDTATGKDVSDEAGTSLATSDPDFSVAQVLDRDTGEQVACLRGRIEPDPFAEYTWALAAWYNWAFIVPEKNFGSGIAFIEGLLRRQYPIGLIYQRKRNADDRRSPSLQELGFDTNQVTKPQLISIAARAIREMSVLIHDPITLQEHRTFVYKANGRMEGMRGCHDDCVIGFALGVVGIGAAPREVRRMEHQLVGTRPPMGQTGPVPYGRRRRLDEFAEVR